MLSLRTVSLFALLAAVAVAIPTTIAGLRNAAKFPIGPHTPEQLDLLLQLAAHVDAPEPSTEPSLEPSLEPSASPEASPMPSGELDDLEASPSTAPSMPVPAAPAAVCIAARHLRHVASEHLVFPTHRRAAVLCDRYGSCATPGHIVVFRGEPMSMRSYCARERLHTDDDSSSSNSAAALGESRRHCTRIQNALVNSPRFERRWRAPSATDGLEFTALAARFESGAEETLLAAAVRAGL